MSIWSCKRCFHIIDEHLLCLEHGGEDAFTPASYKRKRPAPESIPVSWTNFSGPEWAFLDDTPPQFRGKQQSLFEEMVP